MTDLIDREVLINAGGLRIASRSKSGRGKPILRVSFKITKTLQKEPNVAEVTIWNLAQDSRSALQEKGILTEIEAGYFDNTSLIFKGDLDYGATTRDGADWITTLQSSDGSRQYRSSRINLSFDKGTAMGDALRTAAEAMGLGLGNITDELGKGLPRESATEFVKGLVLSGRAPEQFDKIVKRAGFNWSIQDGQVQITRAGGVVNPNEVIVLQPGSGLIGSPERGEDGIVKATALLQPELLPGKKVQIRAVKRDDKFEVDGFYRIEKLDIVGDTGGGEWYSIIEAKPL